LNLSIGKVRRRHPDEPGGLELAFIDKGLWKGEKSEF